MNKGIFRNCFVTLKMFLLYYTYLSLFPVQFTKWTKGFFEIIYLLHYLHSTYFLIFCLIIHYQPELLLGVGRKEQEEGGQCWRLSTGEPCTPWAQRLYSRPLRPLKYFKVANIQYSFLHRYSVSIIIHNVPNFSPVSICVMLARR